MRCENFIPFKNFIRRLFRSSPAKPHWAGEKKAKRRKFLKRQTKWPFLVLFRFSIPAKPSRENFITARPPQGGGMGTLADRCWGKKGAGRLDPRGGGEGRGGPA